MYLCLIENYEGLLAKVHYLDVERSGETQSGKLRSDSVGAVILPEFLRVVSDIFPCSPSFSQQNVEDTTAMGFCLAQ